MNLAERGAAAGPPRSPVLSARDGASRLQKGMLAGFLLVIGGTLVLSSEPGLWLAMAVSPLFLGITIVYLGATFESQDSVANQRAARDARILWPTFTVLVPLYREAAVIEQLIWALERLDYPPDRLEVLLLLEPDDDQTLYALQDIPRPSFLHPVILLEGFPRTKPRALNAGLALATGELLCVFDAEDIPEPDQLKLAAIMFASAGPEVHCLQARLAIDNAPDGWLPRMMAVEYAALFDVIKAGLAGMGLPVPLGGTSNHFRRTSLVKLGGWDAWNVTEDADLGLRIARARGQVLELPSTTFEEAPIRFGGWLRQRRRWLKGWMQTGICHGRMPLRVIEDMGRLAWLVAGLQVAGIVIGALTYPFFAIWAGWNLWTGDIFEAADPLMLTANSLAIGTLLAGSVCMIVPALIGLIRRRAWDLMPWVLTMPVYLLLVSLAAWIALIDLVRRPFHWAKTEHGHGQRRAEGVRNRT